MSIQLVSGKFSDKRWDFTKGDGLRGLFDCINQRFSDIVATAAKEMLEGAINGQMSFVSLVVSEDDPLDIHIWFDVCEDEPVGLKFNLRECALSDCTDEEIGKESVNLFANSLRRLADEIEQQLALEIAGQT